MLRLNLTPQSIILFPFRFPVACCWLLWTWGFRGFRDLYLPKAPLFWGNKDRFVIYFKKGTRGLYEVVLYDLEEQRAEIIFESKTPIHLFGLRHSEELDLCQYDKGNCHYTVINLKNRKQCSPARYEFPGSRFRDHLLPKTLGFISEETVCADNECFTRFRITTANGTSSAGPQITGRLTSGPSVSLNEDLSAFTDLHNVYVSNLLTGTQVAFPFAETWIYNWSVQNVLLACSQANKCLYLIDGVSQASRRIEVPEAGLLQGGAISPGGAYVAYWVLNEDVPHAANAQLFLFSVAENKHYKLMEQAKILDVRWSPHEQYLSVTGIKRCDLFDISYGYKMRNPTVNDKEVIRLDGSTVVNLL